MKTNDAIFAIEDNYEDYFEHTAGFAYDAWDHLTQDELARVDAIDMMSTDERLTSHQTTPFFEWVRLRAMYKDSQFDAFLNDGLTLLEGDAIKTAKRLRSMEITELMLDVAIEREHDASQQRLLALLTQTQDHRGLFLRGLLHTIQSQDGDSLFEQWMEKDDAKAEACVDIAQALKRHHNHSACKRWLMRAQTYAADDDQRAARVDVALMLTALEQITHGEEE